METLKFIMRKLTLEEFIEKAKAIHENKYDYSKVNYVNYTTAVEIGCPIHGCFWQLPTVHLRGCGCQTCVGHAKVTKNSFIKRANKIHNFKYDYSSINFINRLTDIKIGCPIHGYFWQKPSVHLNGGGCSDCALERNKSNTKEFIKKARGVHGSKYEYNKVDYVNSYSNIIITCPIHGDFQQTPHAHLQGKSCFECFRERQSDTLEEFIAKANKKHNFKYDYSRVNYKNRNIKIEIGCPIHGWFWQKPSVHLRTGGCLSCYKAQTASKAEMEVKEYVKLIYSGEIINNSRKVISPYELDIYLPELKLALEYDGTYWHNLREQKYPGYHTKKDKLALKQNIKLIHIKEEDWIKNPNQIKLSIQEEIEKAKSN